MNADVLQDRLCRHRGYQLPPRALGKTFRVSFLLRTPAQFPTSADWSVDSLKESRGRKNSCIHLPSPRTPCSSVSTKKGMSVTNTISETQRIPFNVPPPRSAILS